MKPGAKAHSGPKAAYSTPPSENPRRSINLIFSAACWITGKPPRGAQSFLPVTFGRAGDPDSFIQDSLLLQLLAYLPSAPRPPNRQARQMPKPLPLI